MNGIKKLVRVFVVFCLLAGSVAEAREAKSGRICISPSRVESILAAGGSPGPFLAKSKVSTSGNIVILEADPELLIVSNPFDLRSKTVTFLPALRNRYTFTLRTASFNGEVGETLTLADDDSREVMFENFHFPFAGNSYDRLYVNSNGNITFEQPDPEPPSIDTLLVGAPRIAVFFADLDPESLGTVFIRHESDRLTVTWLRVPEFFNENQFQYGQNTFQAVLYSDGRIDLVYSDEITATEALAGIVPGRGRSGFRGFDFSRGPVESRAFAALIENFHDYESIHIPRLMKSLYRDYRDRYDFVTLISNFDLSPVPDAQAFAINVRNDVLGIGNPGKSRTIFKDNARYGSAGQLQNITFLGNLHQYPSDPGRQVPGTNTSLLQILAHEVGHRWLTYVNVSRDGQPDSVLIGRDRSHWSFFFDSDGSFLEGNQINSPSANSFVTGIPFQRYSDLDLYLMGFLAPEEVRDSYFVEGAGGFSPEFPFAPESSPESNVTFHGTAVPVKIADIIAANGERRPDSTRSQKEFRHLFVLIIKKELPATEAEINFVDVLRLRWETFFESSTRGRGKVSTVVQ